MKDGHVPVLGHVRRCVQCHLLWTDAVYVLEKTVHASPGLF